MKKFLIITQLVYVLFTAPWLIIWGVTFMGLDSGFSYPALAIVAVVGLYPIAVIACSIFAWVFYKRRTRAAVIVNLIPMLWVAGIGLPVLILNLT